MTTENNLHVSQIGENWEVEDATQTLAQADTKEEAIAAAHEAAEDMPVGKIIVHTSDGGTEQEIPARS